MFSKTKNLYLKNNILLQIVEHMSHIKLYAKYTCYSYTYSNIIINKLIFNHPCNALSKYKDFLLLNDKKEFIHRFYYKNEADLRLQKIGVFYEKYSRIFPNYIKLYEGKYIYKNIRKKQKMIDAVNKLICEKNMMQEYEVNNNCFDNEIFKGPLFTDEVEYEIAKDNIINNSNYINNNANMGDSLFTQNSISLYLKSESLSQNNHNKKEIERKPNNDIESFITNNESNGSIYNIMDILNENKIYIDDLKLLLSDNEKININNINNQKKNEGIRKIIIKGNIYGNDLRNNNIKRIESNNELTKPEKKEIENNLNNKQENKKVNSYQFKTLGTISGKTNKSKKIIKSKDSKNFNKDKNNNMNDKNKNLRKILYPEYTNNKKSFFPENNESKSNIKISKKKLTLNNNTNDYSNLQTLPGIDSTKKHYLLTKINKKPTEQKILKTHIKDKNIKIDKKEINSNIKNNISNKLLKNVKKYIRYKHASQDLCTNFYKSKEKMNSQRKNKLNSCNSLSNTLDKINPKIKKESVSSKSTLGTNAKVKSNKDLRNLKKLNNPPIINNQIIIHNNNNYFLTENNNPNLITGTNKNNYDLDDNDSEREKLLIYLNNIAESQRTTQNHRPIISEEKSQEKYEDILIKNINTETSLNNNRIKMNNSQKLKNLKCLKDLLAKQKTEKNLKKNYKYYFNHVNNNTLNYPIIKYNTIRKMHNYKRNNSNFTEKLINSISSVSKIKKYNSNCSLKPEEFISPNKTSNNTIKTINCYSHNENKNYKNIKRNNGGLISKAKTITKKFFQTDKNLLQVSDIISSESTRNILNHGLINKKPKEFEITLMKDEYKGKYSTKNNEILVIDNNKNFELNSTNNKNKHNIKNKRQNSDLKFNTNLIKNKFGSCDFDSIKNNNNFSKGLLDRINNIKNKIKEGIVRNNKSNLIKKEKTQITFNNNVNKNYNCLIDKNLDNYNYIREKRNIKSKKIYENKILNNDNKENIPEYLLIKVNKTKNLGNVKSQIYINTYN